MIVAALALPMPKLMIVMPSAVALGIGTILAAHRHAVPLGEQADVVVEIDQQDVLAELLERRAGVARQPVGNDLGFGFHAVARPVSHRIAVRAS